MKPEIIVNIFKQIKEEIGVELVEDEISYVVNNSILNNQVNNLVKVTIESVINNSLKQIKAHSINEYILINIFIILYFTFKFINKT